MRFTGDYALPNPGVSCARFGGVFEECISASLFSAVWRDFRSLRSPKGVCCLDRCTNALLTANALTSDVSVFSSRIPLLARTGLSRAHLLRTAFQLSYQHVSHTHASIRFDFDAFPNFSTDSSARIKRFHRLLRSTSRPTRERRPLRRRPSRQTRREGSTEEITS